MNGLIAGTFTKQKRDAIMEMDINVSNGCVITESCQDGMSTYTPLSISLPWEILESAYYFFQQKGYEKTTIQDICNRLNIDSTQFHNHFESLDEVLEVLWAR